MKSKYPLEISEKKVLSVWKNAKFQISGDRLQIMYKNKWLNVSREDSCGDVRSWYELEPSVEKQKSIYEDAMFGAFIYDDEFAIIDSGTDG